MSCANIKYNAYDACEGNVGGIKKVYIANYYDSDVDNGGINVDSSTGDTEGVITGFTTGFTAGTTWYEYKFRKNTASMTSTLNIADNGSSNISTELNLVFSKMDAKKRAAIMAMVLSDAAVIVVDNNGLMWYLGEKNPVNVSASAGETGTQFSDNNGYNITLTDNNPQYPRQLSADAFASLTIYNPTA